MPMIAMWCSHCRTETHNDGQCWSTRGMNEPDLWWFLGDCDRCDGDDPRAAVYEEVWQRALEAFNRIPTRGYSEWQDRVRTAVRVLSAAAPEVFAAELAHLERLHSGKTPNVGIEPPRSGRLE